MITRDNSTCSSKASSSALNYPSITVPNLKGSFSVSRTVTNVGRPRSVYKVVVYSPAGVNVTVVPKRLAFNRYGQKINFTVKFEATAPTKDYVFGSLSWRSRRSWVTMPLVVRVVHSRFGLRMQAAPLDLDTQKPQNMKIEILCASFDWSIELVFVVQNLGVGKEQEIIAEGFLVLQMLLEVSSHFSSEYYVLMFSYIFEKY